jgi:hypothetical protein
MGQTRSFGDVGSMSGLPPESDVERTSVDVSNVPGRDIRHGSPRRRDHNADETVAGRAQHVDLKNGNLTRP